MSRRRSPVISRQSEVEFLAAFEAGVEPEGGFHHADHVHVAWCYLTRMPRQAALERFIVSLKAFAAAQGKPERYDEALTRACLRLIAERVDARGACATWAAFAAENADLLVWPPANIGR